MRRSMSSLWWRDSNKTASGKTGAVQSSRLGEYPNEDLIREWISQSDHFLIDGNDVSLSGEEASLTDIQKDVVEIMQDRGAMSSSEIVDALGARGHGRANIAKQIFQSALVYLDRSGGHGHFRFTLVTDLEARDPAGSEDTAYERFKRRLQALATTDVSIETMQRREQRILSEWLYGSAAQCACAICGRAFATRSLVTAHKKKRSICTETEKRDPYIVFPLCTFGCDYLYEHGFVRVERGVVAPGRPASGPTETATVKTLVGRALDPRWTAGPASYFDNLPKAKKIEGGSADGAKLVTAALAEDT